MPAVTKDWYLFPHDPQKIEQLRRELQCSPVIAQLLLNRGIDEVARARLFLGNSLQNLLKPEELPGIPEAVELLHAAVRTKKKIIVYGDYDVDGTTGTAILINLLNSLGANCDYYVPHRINEGYGLNEGALRTLASQGAEVVVSVDCGITSVHEAQVARELNLQLIITDHHEMKETLPQADVLVHPRLPHTNYPFGTLSGAGVAFKLAWALAVRYCGSEKVTPHIREVLLNGLSLACLGLIADVVPLHDENRILVKAGLNRLLETPMIGLRRLIERASSKPDQKIQAEDVAYKLAPRINAVGRLGCARLVVELFTTQDASRAQTIADYLDQLNKERQSLEKQTTEQAKELAEATGAHNRAGVVLFRPDWHIGVVGIVASRMVEYLGKPVIILGGINETDLASGSGRSIHGLALNEALKSCDAYLQSHGGHEKAVGLKIHRDKISEFADAFDNYVKQNYQHKELPRPYLRIDAEIPLSTITMGFIEAIEKMEPYGEGNPRPQFLIGDVMISNVRRIGVGERHLSFHVQQGNQSIRAVAWGMADRFDELLSGQGHACLVFTPKINEWKGAKNVEIEVKDFQPQAQARLMNLG